MDARSVVRLRRRATPLSRGGRAPSRDDASQRGFEQMAIGIGWARRLARAARGAGQRALSSAAAEAGRAGYSVDARIASAGPLYIGGGWFLIGGIAARPGASEFALFDAPPFDDHFATTARYQKEET
ncbi:hypothetical protein F9948_22220 [Burkholderia thailandensis]|nr:hypothetical protein AQ475_29030 [Burkholderia thailandensis]AOJ60691.1 hypothetical protein AQ477_30320 [Burkholderia thailandensis]AVR29288.1 hypothetical protein A8H32_31725 [Burkholderia thailandensis]KXF57679.1 hypothetical protein AQ476_23215 [Burkholderia thailandensis]MDD1482889.1 hypothetical protein [Burkholderia thailandensis]